MNVTSRRKNYGSLKISRAVTQDLVVLRGVVETAPTLIERLTRLVPSSLLRRSRLRTNRYPLAA